MRNQEGANTLNSTVYTKKLLTCNRLAVPKMLCQNLYILGNNHTTCVFMFSRKFPSNLKKKKKRSKIGHWCKLKLVNNQMTWQVVSLPLPAAIAPSCHWCKSSGASQSQSTSSCGSHSGCTGSGVWHLPWNILVKAVYSFLSQIQKEYNKNKDKYV